jgi:hypothetical protein
MLEVIRQFSAFELFWVALAVFLYALNKGGFPVSSIAVPLLVLFWPSSSEPAKTVVAFLLPLLVVMDAIGLVFYRKSIPWKRLLPLLPGAVAGIAVASILFVSQKNSFIYLPDRWLQLFIGIVGVFFIVYQAFKRWFLKKTEGEGVMYGWGVSSIFGFGAGVVSTLSNSALPVAQMYLLPQKLEKMHLAGAVVGMFAVINAMKMVPFALLGRIETENLLLGIWMLPLIPLGVWLGHFLVRVTKPKHYVGFIYAVLGFTSILLIVRTFLR